MSQESERVPRLSRNGRRVVKQLWFWVIVAIALGVVFGLAAPAAAKEAKWLADAFIQLIKAVTGPVIFVTVALALGLLAANIFKPGSGFEGDPSASAREAGNTAPGLVGFITEDLLPTSFVEPFVENEILRILVLAILVAAAISMLADRRREAIVSAFEAISKIIFGVIRLIMWAAPLGAFGGMAYTVSEFGAESLTSLGALMVTFWGTCAFFVLVVLGLVARGGLLELPPDPADPRRAADHRRHELLRDRPPAADRNMSEGRALTNAIGNSVATLVIARWQGELDMERLQHVLHDPSHVDEEVERAMLGVDEEPQPEPTGRFDRAREREIITP